MANEFKIQEPLSEVASVAIRQAVVDAKVCDAHPEYTLYMGQWHLSAVENEGCLVCLAGASMARRTSAEPSDDHYPENFPLMEKRLEGLDAFRNGNISLGLIRFGVDISIASDFPDQIIKSMEPHEELFVRLLSLANELEKAGL